MSPRTSIQHCRQVCVRPDEFCPIPGPGSGISTGALTSVAACCSRTLHHRLNGDLPLTDTPNPNVLILGPTVATISDRARNLQPCRIVPVTLVTTKVDATIKVHSRSARVTARTVLLSNKSGGMLTGVIHRNANGTLSSSSRPVAKSSIGTILSN